ncbi:hypothetical protein GCM10027269_18250 [Kribbella endophytica]
MCGAWGAAAGDVQREEAGRGRQHGGKGSPGHEATIVGDTALGGGWLHMVGVKVGKRALGNPLIGVGNRRALDERMNAALDCSGPGGRLERALSCL